MHLATMQYAPYGRVASECTFSKCTFNVSCWGFAGSSQGFMCLSLKGDLCHVKEQIDISVDNCMNAVQGVLQSLTSTVGSAANTVTSTAKSAVNRLTGDGSNGLTPSYGPTVRHNL